MDKPYPITELEERKRGQHLGSEERGAIQQLKRLGFSNRAIAQEIHCSPSTVGYELKRGTPEYSVMGVDPVTLPSVGRQCIERIERIAVALKGILQTASSFAGR